MRSYNTVNVPLRWDFKSFFFHVLYYLPSSSLHSSIPYFFLTMLRHTQDIISRMENVVMYHVCTVDLMWCSMIPWANIRTLHCTQSCSPIICGYRWKTACINRRDCSPGGFPVSICLNKSLANKHKDISNGAMLKRCQEKVPSCPTLNMFPKIQALIEES